MNESQSQLIDMGAPKTSIGNHTTTNDPTS